MSRQGVARISRFSRGQLAVGKRTLPHSWLATLATLFLAGCAGQSPEHQATTPVAGAYSAPSGLSCQSDLLLRQASFLSLIDRSYGPGCATRDAVRLVSLRSDGGTIALSGLGPLSCPMAERMAGWARFGIDRAARQFLGSPVQRIETMGSYNCRDVASTHRLSAHATANAVDVGGFVLADGRRVSILGQWSAGSTAEQAFLHAVRASACKRFSTVLSPAYNAAHRNHLHVEIGDGQGCR